MADGVLIGDLSVAPSRTWGAVIARHQAVTDYLGIKKPTTSDVDRFSEHLGLSRRMFYRLINDRKRRRTISSSASPIVGRGRPISLAQEAAISEALARLGPGALTRDVYAGARAISAQRGIAFPSEYAVTSRVRTPRFHVEISARLDRRFDWILDTSQLDFDVIEPDGNFGPAYMLALIDVCSGETLTHKVQANKPRSLAIANVVLPELGRLQRSSRGHAGLAVTTTLWPEVSILAPQLHRHGLDAAECAPRSIRSGESFMFVFGRKIGNICLRPRPRRSAANIEKPAIDVDLARAVVGFLVSKRNGELRAARSSLHTEFSNQGLAGAQTIPLHASAPA